MIAKFRWHYISVWSIVLSLLKYENQRYEVLTPKQRYMNVIEKKICLNLQQAQTSLLILVMAFLASCLDSIL